MIKKEVKKHGLVKIDNIMAKFVFAYNSENNGPKKIKINNLIFGPKISFE